MSYSHSTSSGTSQSTPQNMYSAQSAAALDIANAAANLGNYTYNWALNNYATTSAMTGEAVNNYLQMSQYGLGLAQTQLNQYNNTYVPEMNQLAQEAGSYSSAGREAVNAGAAESASQQGTQAGINAATQNLQSYGIDPSSGMYGELQTAQRAAGGAAAAGAGQQAILATEQTGRNLLNQSIGVGAQLPGDVVNSLNSAYQGVAGAENATLANATTGANMIDAANPFYSSAMSLKYPPVGNTSTSVNSSVGSSNPAPKSGSSGSSASGGNPYGTSPSSAGGYMGGQPTVQTGSYGQAPYSGGGGGNSGIPAGAGGSIASIQSVPGGTNNDYTIPAGQGFGGGSPTQMGGYSGGYGSAFSGSGFAAGGAIPDNSTTGGQVPQTASPSMGNETDDIPARLNANEFVIPRDVAEWKGQEFFQKLIDQSRKMRMGATAKPDVGPAPSNGHGPPRFVSHAMAGGAI